MCLPPTAAAACWLSSLAMAALPSRHRNKGGIGGGSTPRRNGAGGGGPASFAARESPGSNNGAPRGSGAWGTGRLGRSFPPARQTTMPHNHHHHHHHVQTSSSAGDAYKVACRDRWINVTKTMMGERAEITTTSGCVYEGVFHVLTPVDPTPGGTRGMYQVCVRLGFSVRVSSSFCDSFWLLVFWFDVVCPG